MTKKLAAEFKDELAALRVKIDETSGRIEALDQKVNTGSIGKLQVKNRLVLLPHGVEFAVDNLPSERHAYYYAERAKGGVGLIVMEACGVHPTSKRRENVTIPYDRRGEAKTN